MYLEDLLKKMKRPYDKLEWESHDGGYKTKDGKIYLYIFMNHSRAGSSVALRVCEGKRRETIVAPHPHISQVPFGRFLRRSAFFFGLPYPRRWDGPQTEEEETRERLRLTLETLYKLARLHDQPEEDPAADF